MVDSLANYRIFLAFFEVYEFIIRLIASELHLQSIAIENNQAAVETLDLELIFASLGRNDFALPTHRIHTVGHVLGTAGVPIRIYLRVNGFAGEILEMVVIVIFGVDTRLIVQSPEYLRRHHLGNLRRGVVHIIRYRTDHYLLAKHILVVDIQHVVIIRKIHRQSPHHRIIICGTTYCRRIYVRCQGVAQFVETGEDVGV